MDRLFMLISALLLLASPAHPHDWWLNPAEGGYEIVKGHLEADGHITADPYPVGKVIQVTGYRAGKDSFPITMGAIKDSSGVVILPSEKIAALTALIYDNCWILSTDGWKNDTVFMDSRPGLIRQGQSYKFTKHIETWQDWMTQPLGQRFEIVPMQNISRLKPGDALPVALVFMGKKVREAELTQTSREDELRKVKTDDVFTVNIVREGFQLIRARVEVPLKEKNFIWYTATLTFNTK